MSSSVSSARPAATDASPVFDASGLNVSAVALQRHDEPVFCLQNDALVPANPLARELAARLAPTDTEKLLELARRAALQDRAVIDLFDVGAGTGLQNLQVTLVPLAGTPGVLLFVRDLTLDNTLRTALVESRRRYKDFIDISSDFPWEVSRARRFVFVPPRGALGHTPEALIASDPTALVAADHGIGIDLPFLTTRRIENEEFWLKRADGRAACMVVSAMPLTDSDGRWIGARGVCRDVTETRERESTLSRVRNRERVLTRIVRAFRDEVDPEAMLTVAADALARGLGAEHCQIFRTAPPDAPLGPVPGFELAAKFGDGADLDPKPVLGSLANGATAAEIVVDCWQVLAAPARYQAGTNGAAVLWRRIERGPWTDDERLLIADIGNQIGVTVEQLTHHEHVLRVSRTDALTGLLNRGAFMDGLKRYLGRQGRGAHDSMSSVLLYVDLDNFKHVNDTLGHQAGDDVLLKVRGILVQGVRPTDMVARLGGDEFAVWLNNADVTIGMRRAEGFLTQARALAAQLATSDRPLGMSIGIAVWVPGGEQLEQLLARADAAMYAAKRAGKGGYQIAPAAGG